MPNLRVIVASLALVGCEFYAHPDLLDTGSGSPDTTIFPDELPTGPLGEPYLGPLVITYLEADCSNGWSLEARTAGWTTRATVDIWEETSGHEAHTLATLESGPWGHWDRLVRTLRITTNPGSWERDVVTQWSCEDTRDLTFAVRIYDATDTLADCGAWGDKPDQVGSTLQQVDGVARSEELSGCTTW